MTDSHYRKRLAVPQTPAHVYDAISRVEQWWTINSDGSARSLGDEFSVQFGDVHRSTQRITEAIPGARLVWRVIASHLPWLADVSEWTGTEMIFALEATGEGTALTFTHVGLIPTVECYAQCEKGWDFFIGTSLHALITTGTGQPDTSARSHMDTIGHVRPRNA
jgi:hypothetical protein